jgi:hypothetical protein
MRLPRARKRGLLRSSHTLLRKRGGVVAVARRQSRDGVDMGVSALHGERSTRFFWNVLVFMMGVLGSPKLYLPLNPGESEIEFTRQNSASITASATFGHSK